MPDAVAFRTDCRSKAEEKPIRAAKCCFEPRGTRLPDARISKPHPRKGTETCCIQNFVCEIERISKPHPRKGTETCAERAYEIPHVSFQNHIPVRGRKLETPFLKKQFKPIISKPYPRKGTETFSASEQLMETRLYFKTTSP